jgi:hypothetical protein
MSNITSQTDCTRASNACRVLQIQERIFDEVTILSQLATSRVLKNGK